MKRAKKGVVLAALVLATGACTTPPQPAPEPEIRVAFQPDQQGLAVLPGNRRIDFGRSPAGVIPVLDRELGPHRELPLSGCPRGVTRQLQWRDLTLTFNREQFIGWRRGISSGGVACTAQG